MKITYTFLNTKGISFFILFLYSINTIIAQTETNKVSSVGLLGFSGKCDGTQILLDWSTSSETNNDYFYIEKSRDCISFEAMGTVMGTGNSTTVNRYSFSDLNVDEGIVYYRLRQADLNGNITTYTPIEVYAYQENDKTTIMSVSTDGSSITLDIASRTEEKYDIVVYGMSGRKMLSLQQYLLKGNNEIKLGGENLETGTYVITLQNDKSLVSSKSIVW
jgi:hypothetical protein